MQRTKRVWVLFPALLLFAVGIAILLYPTAANLYNAYRQDRVIASYREETEAAEPTDAAGELLAAQEYNRELLERGEAVVSALREETNAAYEALLNPNGDGIMGYIVIPKIAVQLPIAHYYSEGNTESLGHLYGSSLPVGGEGTHALLCAHRGLPSAKLFTDLDQLSEGDRFYVHVLGGTLVYEVDQIRTVLPEEVADIVITPGEDYVTLVTCTPYAVNTHRLLVRGTRVREEPGEPEVPSVRQKTRALFDENQKRAFALLGAFAVICLAAAGVRRIRRIQTQKKKAGRRCVEASQPTTGVGQPEKNASERRE